MLGASAIHCMVSVYSHSSTKSMTCTADMSLMSAFCNVCSALFGDPLRSEGSISTHLRQFVRLFVACFVEPCSSGHKLLSLFADMRLDMSDHFFVLLPFGDAFQIFCHPAALGCSLNAHTTSPSRSQRATPKLSVRIKIGETAQFNAFPECKRRTFPSH